MDRDGLHCLSSMFACLRGSAAGGQLVVWSMESSLPDAVFAIDVCVECLEHFDDSFRTLEVPTACPFSVTAVACSMVTVAEAEMPLLPKKEMTATLVCIYLHVRFGSEKKKVEQRGVRFLYEPPTVAA